MEPYRKLEKPTYDHKFNVLVELDREHGIAKCESISAWRIYDKRNHPGKLKKGRRVVTFVGAASEPTITRDKNARFSPVTFKQAELMSKDSIGDFSQWLLSDAGFLIVTDKNGEDISPATQGLWTFSRFCGFRRNVWRKVSSTPNPNSKPLADSTLKDHGKRSRDKYSKHLDTYRADFDGMPVAKLSQSFIVDSQPEIGCATLAEHEREQAMFFTQEATVTTARVVKAEAGWILTPVKECDVPLNEDGSVYVDIDTMQHHERLPA